MKASTMFRLGTFLTIAIAISAATAAHAGPKPRHSDAPPCHAPASLSAVHYALIKQTMAAGGPGRLRLSGVDISDEDFPAAMESRVWAAMRLMRIEGVTAVSYDPGVKRRSCSGTLSMPGAEHLGQLPVAYTLQPYSDGSDVAVTARLITMGGHIGVNQVLGVQALMLRAMFADELKAAERESAAAPAN